MIREFISTIKEICRYGCIPPSNGIERELFFLKRAIRETECRLSDIYRLDVTCCHDCDYGAYHLEAKLKRQQMRLKQLTEKKARKK